MSVSKKFLRFVTDSLRFAVVLVLFSATSLSSLCAGTRSPFAPPFSGEVALGVTDRLSSKSTVSENVFFGNLSTHISRKGDVKTFPIRIKPAQPRPRIAGVSIAPPDPNQAFSGESFLTPVRGRITSPFGSRRHPRSGRTSFHSGVDIAARRGTAITAAASGRVSFSGWNRGYGLMVVIDHGGGIQTVYAHCSTTSVKKGDRIKAGQKIAKVGSTGVTTGSHLHFEVRRNGKVQNPLRFLRL